MKGSGSRRGNKSEEANIYIYIYMERVAEQSGEEQVEEVRHWYGEVGANSRIPVCNAWKSWSGRNKPEWIVEMRGEPRRDQRHEENHGPHPLTAKSWYTAQFRSCYSTFQGGEHRKLVSFSRHSCMYACVCEWNRNNTRFIMPLSEGLWGRQLVAGGSNHFPQLGRFDGVFCVEGKVSIRGREFSILFRPI